jgi:nucleoside-diphosphate-sugar epimerase
MKNLVIGNTSQLSYYFPKNYIKVSSRNLNLKELSFEKWDSVYICFAEQRTYLANAVDENTRNMFWSTNVDMTLETIEKIQNCCNRIVYYSTAELWNKTIGPINVTDPFSYHNNNYTESKKHITDILKDKKKYPKVSIFYPFNFNGVYRGDKYLFGKIFDSIKNKTKIVIGDTDFYRELLHPQMIVNASISWDTIGEDYLIGSGRLLHVGDFIKRLYSEFDMDYNEFVEENITSTSFYRLNIFYSSVYNSEFCGDKLFEITVKELKESMKGIYYETK